LIVLKQNESHTTNVYLDGREMQATVIDAVRNYDYETGGN
jgi:hypothetical protein